MNSRFVRFLFAGGIAAGVNLGSRKLLNLAMPFEVAVVLAYLLGMTTAYLISRYFVFEKTGRSVRSEASRFAVVNLFSMALVWAISVGLLRIVFPFVGLTWHADDIAHFVGVSAPAVLSYWGHAQFSFARADPGDAGSPPKLS